MSEAIGLSVEYLMPGQSYSSGTATYPIATVIGGCECHVHLGPKHTLVYVWAQDGGPSLRAIRKAVKRVRKVRGV